jgi:hypothetical protein
MANANIIPAMTWKVMLHEKLISRVITSRLPAIMMITPCTMMSDTKKKMRLM